MGHHAKLKVWKNDMVYNCGIGGVSRSDEIPQAKIQLLYPEMKKLKDWDKNVDFSSFYLQYSSIQGTMSTTKNKIHIKMAN